MWRKISHLPRPAAHTVNTKGAGSITARMAAYYTLRDLKKVGFGQEATPGLEVGEADAPGVILVQEWWGVTDVVKQQACAVASKGYRVLIPDLYKGVIGVDMEEAGHLMTSLDYHRAVEEIRWAAQYLLATGSPKVGITGE